MENEYSPYRYVDLTPQKWDERSDELLREELQKKDTDADPAQAVGARLFKEIVIELFKYPHDALKQSGSKGPKNICVIGGGIAGLAAAYELVVRGHMVTVLEASDRLGGRIRTHRFSDGLYGELGPMRIPQSHGCVNHYVDQFGLSKSKRPFVSYNGRAHLYLRGEPSRLNAPENPREWEKFLNLYEITDEPTVGWSDPFDSAFNLVEGITGRITYGDLNLVLRDFEIPPHLQFAEETSLGQLMRGHPMTRPGIRHLSNEAFEFLGRATGMIWFERASLLQFVLNELALTEPRKYELENGMETLVESFEREILRSAKQESQAPIMRNAEVKSLVFRGEQVEVMWGSGGQTFMGSYDCVICTAPAPCAVRIKFDPPLSPRKYEALTNLSYASAAKTIVRCSKRFWELDDGIYGGGSYTDLPNQQCWYPSDNARLGRDARFKFGHIREDAQPLDWECKDAGRSKQPGVFTAAYMWEANARRFAALDRRARTELVLSSVEKLHPGFRAFIEDKERDVEHCAWDAESSPGGGAFAFFAPGEQRRYQTALCEPHFRDLRGQPRLFFAGEHIAVTHAWIQSAIQSALSAVIHVLNAP